VNYRRCLVTAALTFAFGLSLSGCSGNAATASLSAALTAPADSPAPPSATPPTSAPTTAGIAFQTRFFSPSLDLAVPSFVKPVPDEESAHFLTFFAADGSRAIRIMEPVSIYRPSESEASVVPADYVAYLDGLSSVGVQLTDRVETTVDGHKTTIETAASGQTFDGSIGCPRKGLAAADCFGVGDELILRIAVIETEDGPLLAWLRLRVADAPDMTMEAANFAASTRGRSRWTTRRRTTRT
jgi:hypothetical protein